MRAMSLREVTEPAVLLVEDDELIGELISLNLTRAGYRVTWARDGREGLKRLKESAPDLMLLDLGLPKIDGFAVLTEIRRRHAMNQLVFTHMPIIVMTARHTVDDVRRALALGASDYLAKPFEIPTLLARMARHLGPRAPRPGAPSNPNA
jgi:DNA-binding response OmpR family regulator